MVALAARPSGCSTKIALEKKITAVMLGHVTGDGLCMKFYSKDPPSVAFDFTVDEQEKNGAKLKTLMLTQNRGSRTSSDSNTITVTFDMKSGTEEAPAPTRRPT